MLRVVDLSALLLQSDGFADTPAGEQLAALSARYAQGAQAAVGDLQGVPQELGLDDPMSMRHVREGGAAEGARVAAAVAA